MRRMGQMGLAVVATLLLVLGSARGVGGHSNYERSDPPANAILAQAPNQVRGWFSEEPETRFSELQIMDASRRRVDRNDMSAVPGDPRALMIDVQDNLAPGTYTVLWKT